ncbi:MAG: hypothetical protein A3K10_16365 [Bacteroidetes bacterium RIFCSPLOWO2_12_FULL_31_6]|nr:MAG: hypothetical protein A3K10_16365 [Bacteroidetes bacterium RIFCSPLOWO2_12_FULL_31_6]
MKKLISISIVILLSIQGFSQKYADKNIYLIDSLDLSILTTNERQLIDSCLNLFHNSTVDTIKIAAINYIVEECYNEKVWPKYNDYLYQFLIKKIKKDNSSIKDDNIKYWLSISIHNKAYYFDEQGDFKNALKYYNLSLKVREHFGSEVEIGEALNYLGYFHKKHGNILEAVEYYHKSLKIREKIGDKEGEATNLNNLGVIFMTQDNISLSLEYFKKSLKIRQEIGFKFGVAESFNNIGYLYHFYGDPNCKKNKDTCLLEGKIKALDYYHKSLVIREEINNKKEIAMSLNNIGAIYEAIGDPLCKLSPKKCKEIGLQKAMEYYTKSLKLREESNDKIGVGISYNNMGGVYLKLGDREKAKFYITKALSIYQKMGSPVNIGNSSNLLAEIYEQENKGMEALKMYRLHIRMRDSLNNESTQKASIEQKTKYEYEKQKALDDVVNEKKLAIEKEAKAKQKVITYATAGGLGLVAIFLIFVFNRLQVTRKQKTVIEQQKTVVEKAHHELEEKNKEITDSIQYAKRIQNAILPPTKLVKEYLPQSFILYKPKDIVAGDFYWMEHKNGKILFAAADCTGHGVPGAMVSVVCNNGLNRSVREHGLTEPGQILDKTREIVIQEFEKSDEEVKDGMDISLCGLDLNNNKLTWSGANNPLWIIRSSRHSGLDPESVDKIPHQVRNDDAQYRNDGNFELIEYKADKQPIGKYTEAKPFTTHEIQLQKDDSIYIFTDGYQDQFGGEKGKKFKAAKLRELLLSIQHEPMEKQREIIDQSFETWKGSLEQVDDVCIIGVRV